MNLAFRGGYLRWGPVLIHAQSSQRKLSGNSPMRSRIAGRHSSPARCLSRRRFVTHPIPSYSKCHTTRATVLAYFGRSIEYITATLPLQKCLPTICELLIFTVNMFLDKSAHLWIARGPNGFLCQLIIGSLFYWESYRIQSSWWKIYFTDMS